MKLKIIYLCSVISLLCGNSAFGMDFDENELYEDPWNAVPSESQNEKKLKDQSKDELLELQREKITKYESALQKLNQQLKEEREKNRLAEEKIEKLQQKLENIKIEGRIQKPDENDENLASDSKQEPKPLTRFERQKQQLQQLNKIFEQNQIKIKELRKQFKKYEPQPNFVISEKNENLQKSPQEQLFEAIQNGNLADASNAIKNGADVNTPDKSGNTPLFFAAYYGRENIVKYLVNKHADIDRINNLGDTPLYIAAQNGHENIIKYLALQGADINKMNSEGASPLIVASQQGHKNVVRYLIEHKADIDSGRAHPLIFAALHGHLDVVKYLVEQGADINVKDKEGYTPLLAAIQNGHLDTVKFLIEHGAIYKAINGNVTPLWTAAKNGHLDIVRYLVENGDYINASVFLNLTPLYIAKVIKKIPVLTNAQRQKYEEIIEYLESKGAK